MISQAGKIREREKEKEKEKGKVQPPSVSQRYVNYGECFGHELSLNGTGGSSPAW